jgi:ergothioneine biosynthesis protein EgtB
MGGPRDVVAAVLEARRSTMRLVEPLAVDDWVAQSMPDASPVKWHLAHTTWFFERFVLRAIGVEPVNAAYDYLFNSYYESVGPRQPRAQRGLLTRPTVAEVIAYRKAVDSRLADLAGSKRLPEVEDALELGLHHEQQHQELLLTDVKHLFGSNALRPAYRSRATQSPPAASILEWRAHPGGIVAIGDSGVTFAFDNERPRHDELVRPFSLASRAVTCAEYQAFVDDAGYRRPELWLSDGWAWVQAENRSAPLYWQDEGTIFTLDGVRARNANEPATHVSFYEADAYARWAGARLPSELEWEVAAAKADRTSDGAFVEDDVLHPRGGSDALFGDVWEWTASAYAPYPGFRPLAGAFGEYNGKFMVSQLVLRGGSCATPRAHVRDTYRNFFPPSAQWQFSGIRLARDA